ncbi:MAG TPA: hypothetical protein VFC44_06130 [Candidatus Saccharimonadales bacterium]|nr:hypothetical protein [Candidatus Saccharimonadales bacterium]
MNISEWEEKRMRALAECAGVEFRTLVKHAIFSRWREMEKNMGLKASAALKMSRAQRRAVGRERRVFQTAMGHYMAWKLEGN